MHTNSCHVACRTLEDPSEQDGGRGVPGTRTGHPQRGRSHEAGSVLDGRSCGKEEEGALGPRRQSTCPRVTYLRHVAGGCSGSWSEDPSVAKNVKGQASSIMVTMSSSRMGKSVSVMNTIWKER